MSQNQKDILFHLACLYMLFFLPNNVYSQKNISGQIIDKETKRPISYATIGLINENIGTSSDVDGNFTLISKMKMNDSLRISCVGYKTMIYRLSEAADSFVYQLEAKANVLKEVVINRGAKGALFLNDFDNCSLNYYHVSLGAINQIAVLFESPNPNMILDEITLCKENADALFRIRIYGMDSLTGSPLDDLSDSIITVKAAKRNVNIDLVKYNIVLPTKQFFVAIEWLFIPQNAFTMKTKINGTKYIYTSYNPGIAYNFKNKAKLIENPNKVWVQNYNGKWKPIDLVQNNINFLIKAKVR